MQMQALETVILELSHNGCPNDRYMGSGNTMRWVVYDEGLLGGGGD